MMCSGFPVNNTINMQMNDQLKEKSNMKCSYCRESVLHSVQVKCAVQTQTSDRQLGITPY